MTTNAAMVQLWNGPASVAWSQAADQYDAMLEGLGARLLAAAHLSEGERVLDVGCGTGRMSRLAAAEVGSDGAVVGVDVSAGLLAEARARSDEGLRFLEADAQTHVFDEPFDVVLSRFGVMFFDDPVGAFRNLLAATRPGGRLVFVAWQAPPLNEWIVLPLSVIVPLVGPPELPEPGAPGPFAFADRERVEALLADAGWTEVTTEDVREDVPVGGAATAAEAVAFTSSDTFGQMLLAKATEDQRTEARTTLEKAYQERMVDGRVRLGAAAWLVTARKP
jgi:ubiquinone/menaquinone biosynthesis C-methylase UbiE